MCIKMKPKLYKKYHFSKTHILFFWIKSWGTSNNISWWSNLMFQSSYISENFVNKSVDCSGTKHNEVLNWYRMNWRRFQLPPLFAEIYDVPKLATPNEIGNDMSNASGHLNHPPPLQFQPADQRTAASVTSSTVVDGRPLATISEWFCKTRFCMFYQISIYSM